MKQKITAWIIVASYMASLTACMAFENYNPKFDSGKIPRNNAAVESTPHSEPTKQTTVKAQQGASAASTTPAKNVSGDECVAVGVKGDEIFFQSDHGNEKVEKLKVGADGYGAPPKNYYPEGQRRLMTIRASKVDALRALAEVVGGLHIWGGTAIADMVVERDRYRLFIDTYVRGARVISIDPRDDGTVKTTVEMEVSQRFLNQVMAFVDPAAAKNCASSDAKDTGQFAYGPGSGSAPSYYYSE